MEMSKLRAAYVLFDSAIISFFVYLLFFGLKFLLVARNTPIGDFLYEGMAAAAMVTGTVFGQEVGQTAWFFVFPFAAPLLSAVGAFILIRKPTPNDKIRLHSRLLAVGVGMAFAIQPFGLMWFGSG